MVQRFGAVIVRLGGKVKIRAEMQAEMDNITQRLERREQLRREQAERLEEEKYVVDEELARVRKDLMLAQRALRSLEQQHQSREGSCSPSTVAADAKLRARSVEALQEWSTVNQEN